MMARFRSISMSAAVAGVAILLGAGDRVLAQARMSADNLAVKSAQVGVGGKFKAGFWSPVRLTVVAGTSGAQGRLELVVSDGDLAPVIYRNEQAAELDLRPGEETTVLLYAKAGPVGAPFTVQLRREDRVVWSQRLSTGTALLSTQELVVGLGPPTGLDEAAATIRRQSDVALQVSQVRLPAELPDRWWGYEGVDKVVLSTSDAALLTAMSDDQRQALLDWVLLGGRLVLCVGARGAEVTRESPWSALVPGDFAEVAPLQERSGLETFTKFTLPFEEEAFQRNRPRITRLTNIRGEVLVGEEASGARPLVVRATAGLGEVLFVGLDLDHPSLASWPGRTRLLASLLEQSRERREGSERETRRGVAHLGYQDLSGQLRTALDQFPGVIVVNFTTVSVLTITYLLLIGPVDFLFLSRLRLPRQTTWFTFPLVAVGVMALAWNLTAMTHGSRVRMQQAEIIDIDLQRQRARGTVWTQLYSPTTTHYAPTLQVEFPIAKEPPQGWLSWQGLPGNSLGGLGSRQVALVKSEPYQASMPGSEMKLTGLSVPIAASKCLSARWWCNTALPTEFELTSDQFGLLAGQFRLPLQVELADCILAHGEKMYRLGRLTPGETVSIDSQASLNLEWRLTLRRVEASKDIATPWDQASTDVPRIVQMLMFHEAARGRAYTGLTHRYQPYVDLSEHVRLGQAVLVGRAKESVARLRDGNQPLAGPAETNTWTWYRIVFPVKQKAGTQP